MRPRGSTAVASSITTPAPDIASVMAFCRCHSVGSPSIAEYWHIGEIAMRFGATSGPISTGLNSKAMEFPSSIEALEAWLDERPLAALPYTARPGFVISRKAHDTFISARGGSGELAAQSLERRVDPGAVTDPGLDRRGLLHLGFLLGLGRA